MSYAKNVGVTTQKYTLLNIIKTTDISQEDVKKSWIEPNIMQSVTNLFTSISSYGGQRRKRNPVHRLLSKISNHLNEEDWNTQYGGHRRRNPVHNLLSKISNQMEDDQYDTPKWKRNSNIKRKFKKFIYKNITSNG